jgi:hypothetical protein
MYLGKWIRHSGWNKQFKPKLFNRNKGRFTDAVAHETVVIEGEVGRLEHPLRHYTYPDMATVRAKMESQADWGAEFLDQKGKRPSRLNAYTHSAWTFFRTYVLNAGFLDGQIGLTLAKNRAYTVYLKYIRHWQRHRDAGRGD